MQPRLAALLLLVWFCHVAAVAGSSVVWLDVPFVRQPNHGCGAAAIAMVFEYWGRQQGQPPDHTPGVDQIQRVLYSRAAHGIYASAMERYFRDHRFSTFVFRGSWEDLDQHLAKGRPLIVAVKPSAGQSLHYLVVAGLDRGESGIVLVNDPAQRKLLKLDRASFERQWRATDHWTLLAVPQPDRP
jgi:ABC-type bacteriocin/lantibiotic exporter with double-glycine peptidase domain